MSRLYRFDLKVRSAQLPAKEEAMEAATAALWPFDSWDVEPDGQYWGTGQGSFSGHEAPFAEKLDAAVRAVLGADAKVEVIATDLDSAPEAHYRFDPK